MVEKPVTAEEAIRAYEELRAKNEAKEVRPAVGPEPRTPQPDLKLEDLHARISLAAGIEIDTVNKQVLRRSLYPKIEIDVPPDRADLLDALHRNQAILNILIGEFQGAHLLKTEKPDLIHFPEVQAPPKPDLEWITSDKNPALEFIPADRPGTESFLALAKEKKDGYWLFDTGRGQLIFRYKRVTEK
jgi:hypothetical protein